VTTGNISLLCGKWMVIVIQKIERVPVVSELHVKVVDRQSKTAANVASLTSHLEDGKVPKLELTMNLN